MLKTTLKFLFKHLLNVDNLVIPNFEQTRTVQGQWKHMHFGPFWNEYYTLYHMSNCIKPHHQPTRAKADQIFITPTTPLMALMFI